MWCPSMGESQRQPYGLRRIATQVRLDLSHLPRHPDRVIPDRMRLKAERRLRQLLAEDGFAQPDIVQHQDESVLLYWHEVEVAIVVDIDEKGEIGESRLGTPPEPSSATPPNRALKAPPDGSPNAAHNGTAGHQPTA